MLSFNEYIFSMHFTNYLGCQIDMMKAKHFLPFINPGNESFYISDNLEIYIPFLNPSNCSKINVIDKPRDRCMCQNPDHNFNFRIRSI